MRYYPQLREELIRVVMVHPGNFILPELGEDWGATPNGNCASASGSDQRRACGNYDVVVGHVSDGTSIPAATLIWTAG